VLEMCLLWKRESGGGLGCGGLPRMGLTGIGGLVREKGLIVTSLG